MSNERPVTDGALEVYSALNNIDLAMELIERALLAVASTNLSESEVALIRDQVNSRQDRLKARFGEIS